MSVSEFRVSLRIGYLLKTLRPSVHFSELTFDAYARNKQLCVCTTIKNYLKRTSNIRGSETRLFLTSRPPFHVASRDTLRCWTKDLLKVAGIDLNTFSPHSTRSAASSKAALKLPLSTVISTVRWSTESTFAKFYRKPLENPTLLSEVVLSTEL